MVLMYTHVLQRGGLGVRSPADRLVAPRERGVGRVSDLPNEEDQRGVVDNARAIIRRLYTLRRRWRPGGPWFKPTGVAESAGASRGEAVSRHTC